MDFLTSIGIIKARGTCRELLQNQNCSIKIIHRASFRALAKGNKMIGEWEGQSCICMQSRLSNIGGLKSMQKSDFLHMTQHILVKSGTVFIQTL